MNLAVQSLYLLIFFRSNPRKALPECILCFCFFHHFNLYVKFSCIFRQIFEQYLRDKSIILDHTIELWSIPTIKNLVKNNVGVSFLPEFTVTEELNRGELVKIPTAISGTKITAVCAHHKNKWVSPLMQLFISLCDSVSCGRER